MAKKRLDQLPPYTSWVIASLLACLMLVGLFFGLKHLAEKFESEIIARDKARSASFKSLNERRAERIARAHKDREKEAETSTEVATKRRSANTVYWSYEGSTGPLDWATLSPDYIACSKGKRQSPVDLTDAATTPSLPPVAFNYTTTELALENNGKSIISKVKDKNSHLVFQEKRYKLTLVSFHTPSEHYLDGAPYDLEIQFHHTDKNGNMVKVGVFLEASGQTNKAIEKFWNEIPFNRGEKAPSIRLNPEVFLPFKRRYFHYSGSETTPPCEEGVTWIVLDQPVVISIRQLDKFREVIKQNSRPVQPSMGRSIKKSRVY